MYIFTMVSYFLRWTLLKFFSSFSDEQSQQKVRQWSRITCVVINTSIEVKCPLLWEFWLYNLPRRILERVFVGGIVNIRNECLFSLGSWGMNRSAEQTNRTICLSRATIHTPWTKKKRHSFLKTGEVCREEETSDNESVAGPSNTMYWQSHYHDSRHDWFRGLKATCSEHSSSRLLKLSFSLNITKKSCPW